MMLGAGAYMEQGVAMPAAGEDDIHGRCRQLEMALQHAQVMLGNPITHNAPVSNSL